MAVKNTVKVRVRCIVDIPIGTWSDGETLQHLSEVGRREGLEKLEKIMRDNNGAVCGVPTVVVVIVEEER